MNFLIFTDGDGYMPPVVLRQSNLDEVRPADIYAENMHKPVLAQHAAFLVRNGNGDVEWLRNDFRKLQYHINNYVNHHKHKPTGQFYREEREKLVLAIRKHCYDERDGFFYNVDINLREIDFEKEPFYHKGMPRHWDCLIQRIDVWSGFMALWAGVATEEEAARVVARYRDTKSFNCTGGVRTLSPQEKMYRIVASNNPSCWLGPVWGISNYMTFRGLVEYGYLEEARELCERTITLFGRDVIRNGGNARILFS